MSATTKRELPLATASSYGSSNGCACCAPEGTAPAEQAVPAPDARTVAEYRVAGMTCGHCAASISEKLRSLEGVSEVLIALVPGGVSTVTLAGVRPVPESAVQAAVAAAGYHLANS